MAFVLKIIGNGETADFLNGSEFKVVDGGFDIGTPQVNRRAFPFGVNRFQSLDEYYEWRDATIRFEIHGTDRSDVISKLHKIERIIGVANSRHSLAKPVELQYAWDGQSNITYFDVIGADPVLDPGTLSIERMFETRDGKQVLGGLELRMRLSPFGYYISPVSGTPTEVPLAINGSAKATGGRTVYNPYSTNADKNWVEVAGSDIASGGKVLTRLEITLSQADWETIHIGQRITPFPSSTLLLEAESGTSGPGGGSVVPHASASNGNYVNFQEVGAHAATLDVNFPVREWVLGPTYKGRYLVMANSFGKVNENVTSTDSGIWMTSGIAEYLETYRRWLNRWRKLSINPDRQPIGVFQVPMEDLDLDAYGTLADTQLGIFLGWDSGAGTFNFDLDSISLLPIDQGYRLLVHRSGSGSTGTVIDDGWRNMLAYKRTSDSKVIPNVIGIYDPISLVPSVTQRLYFNVGYTESLFGSSSATSYTVRMYVVPTSVAMAV